jgi:MFS family permease
MLATGLVLVPSGLVMMATAPLSARISKARGPKATLMLGAVVVAAGYGLGVVLMSSVWHLVFVSAMIGAGIGLAYGAMPALIMSAVPVSETAAANSLNTLMRAIGTSISSAVAGVILAQLTISFGPVAVPSQGGFRLIMAIGSATALAAFAIAAFIPGSRSHAESAVTDSRHGEAVAAAR